MKKNTNLSNVQHIKFADFDPKIECRIKKIRGNGGCKWVSLIGNQHNQQTKYVTLTCDPWKTQVDPHTQKW